jgi:hypothetical protein
MGRRNPLPSLWADAADTEQLADPLASGDQATPGQPIEQRRRQRLIRPLLGLAASLRWPAARPAMPSSPSGLDTSRLHPTGRGHALREAHRALRQRLRSHPALRSMVPHLWALERALARRGSAALRELPVAVLQRGLQQLTLLQRDDEPEQDALKLRVLRLRLMEAIELRDDTPDTRFGDSRPSPFGGQGVDPRGADDPSAAPASHQSSRPSS